MPGQLLVVAALLLGLRCRISPPPSSTSTVVGEPANSAPLASTSSSADEGTWPRVDLASLRMLTSEPRPSTAHGGRYRVRVAMSDPGLDPSSVAPVGLVVCVTHTEASDGTDGPITCMKKEAPGYAPNDGDWRFAVARAGAREWLREGRLDDCAGCHRAAPHDGRFGP